MRMFGAFVLLILSACSSVLPPAQDAGSVSVADAGLDASTELPRYGTQTIVVESTAYWTNSGLAVRPGTEVSWTATGSWTNLAGGIALHGPEGLSVQPIEGCPWGSLVAKIGLHSGDSFRCLGASGTLVADAGGILYLGPADYVLEDNGGAVLVTVTSSGPPSPSLGSNEIERFDFESVGSDEIELYSNHVILTLPVALAAAHRGTAVGALAEFDRWYELHQSLAGSSPYRGQRVRYFPDVNVRSLGAWMIAGNPIRIDPMTLDGSPGRENILQSADPKFSVWGFVHELGHNFTSINGGLYLIGPGPTEAWANVFAVHALEAIGHPEAMKDACGGTAAYLASGTYSTFRADPWLPLCMLLELKAQYGWALFEAFFRDYNTTNHASVPQLTAPDADRWAWLRNRLNVSANADTTPIFQKYKIPLK